MTIYTGRGDEGLTDLRDMSRVSKASPRIEAYGTVDELNALLGTIRPTGHADLDAHLRTIQNHLHIVQADLSNPDTDSDEDDPVVEARHVEALEGWIDEAEEELEPLQSFVLPGGGAVGSKLHLARTVCRRAERRGVSLLAGEDDDTSDEDQVNDTTVVYLNRLSDALFVFARLANQREGVPEESPTY
ncbi:MAG: cob(I)yrinic acid a,c-diamide adenosyltransferase [Halodesulfurarchaeum sp.]